jgi:hypothetical protein
MIIAILCLVLHCLCWWAFSYFMFTLDNFTQLDRIALFTLYNLSTLALTCGVAKVSSLFTEEDDG